jgi:hypothetical protein
MTDPVRITEEALVDWARRRGLDLDLARAAALRPLAESLLGRLARFAELLPREAAPPPLGRLEEPGRRDPDS